MRRARAALARGLGLPATEAKTVGVDDALVMGVFYACQTDLTLLAPLAVEGGTTTAAGGTTTMDAHMAWIEGAPHLGEEKGSGPTGPSFFSACSLLPPELLEAMEAREDRENYHTRGYGLPATRWVRRGVGLGVMRGVWT